jgi:hypothetical protein
MLIWMHRCKANTWGVTTPFKISKGLVLLFARIASLSKINTRPSREPQRRLNNTMREVVKKEVRKLLRKGIIYDVPNSEWVSPVQVVPKKGGMMVLSRVGGCL